MATKPIQALINWREQNAKTLEDLRKLLKEQRGLETTRATLSRLEKGKSTLTREWMLALSAVTGLSIAQLDPEFAQSMQAAE